VTSAWGINDVGQVVGFYEDGTGTHGFLATPTTVPEPGTFALMVAGPRCSGASPGVGSAAPSPDRAQAGDAGVRPVTQRPSRARRDAPPVPRG
jgi:probable HAF family extracellular repeat protein